MPYDFFTRKTNDQKVSSKKYMDSEAEPRDNIAGDTSRRTETNLVGSMSLMRRKFRDKAYRIRKHY